MNRNFLLCSMLAGILLFCWGCGANIPEATQTEQFPENPQITIEYISPAQTLTVCDHLKDCTMEMELEDYVFHALAAEMFAEYDPEALKAQACAIRTFAVYKMNHGGCAVHAADICTDYHNCLAFLRDEEFAECWGQDEAAYAKKLKQAVADTAGELIYYDGEPIFAVFHSNAGGSTEDIVHVFGENMPYLKSVESYEPEDSFKYTQEAEFTNAEFDRIMQEAYPQYLPREIEIISRYDSGRVDRVKIGGIELKGTEVRALFSLNSAHFDITQKDQSVLFHVVGYGHGVGMSQAGAQELALRGYDYVDILKHYYTGVSIEKS